jgi:hypothetical protein
MDPMTTRRVHDRMNDLYRAADEERLAREARDICVPVAPSGGRASALRHLRVAASLQSSPRSAGARTRA